MKSFVAFLVFLAVITAVPQIDAKRYRKAADDYKRIEVPATATKAKPILDCFEAAHKMKEQCLTIMRTDLGDEMKKCETETAKSGEHCTEAKKQMHDGLEHCLKQEYANKTATHRRRRTATSAPTEVKKYSNHQECWTDLKTKYEECKTKIAECETFSLCTGMGTEPNKDDARWWTYMYMKATREKKEWKGKKHMKHLVDCLHITVADGDGLAAFINKE